MAVNAATRTAGETSASAGKSLTSHSNRRHSRNKKNDDPFLAIPDGPINLFVQPSPSEQHENHSDQSQSRFSDFVLMPISMISFILSLFVVDARQRQWRLSQHSSSPPPASRWARLSSWLDPEPYPESRDHDHDRQQTGGRPSAAAPPHHQHDSGAFAGWYKHTMQKTMAKLEITDAFEMRGRVLVALSAWLIIGLIATVYALRRVYFWILA